MEHELLKTPRNVRPDTTELLKLHQYDHIIVSTSGGKDSLACLLLVLDLCKADGVGRQKIQLWHQDVDSPGCRFMDWPCTSGYVRALAKTFGLKVFFQYRVGGFEAEMLRENQRTEGVTFEAQSGATIHLPTKGGKHSTRRKFPQTSANLSVRWCSAYLKIDVAARAINNDPDLKDKAILFVTGERAEESAARACYPSADKHRCNTNTRRVDQWRPIRDWGEVSVWGIIERHNIIPHPAYFLGFGRVSCMACIFGDKDQWATVRVLDPATFERIAGYEEEFECTIKNGQSIRDMADAGTPFPQCVKGSGFQDAMNVHLAMSEEYGGVEQLNAAQWTQPAGAYKRCGGPI
jgi:3'-phosphoadenosine 5'-phosphosulfate sulfotransferase (PAPS reductase)/FAD synthetase